MKHKPIRIDWDELDAAFNNQNDELVYYLDLVTGHVVLEGEGEGEEDEFDEADDLPRSTAADATRGYIEPVDHATKLVWMREFLENDSELDAEATEQLKQALGADDPAEALGQVLRENPEARDRWYVYRSDRIHDLIDRWVDESEIVVVDPPPWR